MKNKKKNTLEIPKKTSVSINTYYLNIIDQEIKSGRYNTISQVFMAGLRLLEKEEVNTAKKRKNRLIV